MVELRLRLEEISQQLQGIMAVLENDYDETYISGYLGAADTIIDYVNTFILPGDKYYEQHKSN